VDAIDARSVSNESESAHDALGIMGFDTRPTSSEPETTHVLSRPESGEGGEGNFGFGEGGEFEGGIFGGIFTGHDSPMSEGGVGGKCEVGISTGHEPPMPEGGVGEEGTGHDSPTPESGVGGECEGGICKDHDSAMLESGVGGDAIPVF
jgi:hypothetical protein